MPTKLFVGNISYRMTEDELRQLFSQGGREVVSVFIPLERDTHRPRGFAFVEMANEEQAEAAIAELHGKDVNGRQIAVNKARPMEARTSRSSY